MLQLEDLKLNSISGAGIQTYPALYPGERLIGWEKNFLYYEEQTFIEYGLFTDTVYITKIPVYDIRPIIETYYF